MDDTLPAPSLGTRNPVFREKPDFFRGSICGRALKRLAKPTKPSGLDARLGWITIQPRALLEVARTR